jgi:hypothetical protein
MLFMQMDHGAIVSKETGHETSKMIRFVIGNPLIMKEMAKHVADAGSYAPVTVPVARPVKCLRSAPTFSLWWTDSIDSLFCGSFFTVYDNLGHLPVARSHSQRHEKRRVLAAGTS